MAVEANGGDVHIDVPLSNLAIRAFSGEGQFIAEKLMPIVKVNKQSDKYYIIDKDSWLGVPSTLRAPKTSPKRITFKVSSESFYCDNYALAHENAKEDLANADSALNLRKNSTDVCVQGLKRDYEVRVANTVTSGTNLGSYVSLTGGNKWNDFANSDPLSDITTAHAFIEGNTGLMANALVIDKQTFDIVKRHPQLLDQYKYTKGGMLNLDNLKDAFGVSNILVPSGIKNMANEGATASIVNIWGNNVILARVVPGVSLQTQTFGLSLRWQPKGAAGAMSVIRYDDADKGKKVEIVSADYYQDEKIVASDLAYGIMGTL